ncbi:ABC transporter permease [Okibacterium endophyticum]
MVWLPVTLILAWWFSTANGGTFFFPSLATILERFQFHFLSPNITDSLLPSLTNLALGFLIACVFGVLAGVLLGLNEWAQAITAPIVHFFRSLPGPALLPLFMILFGIDMTMKVWIIAFTAFFAVLLNTIDGVRANDPRWVDVCRSYKISSPRRFLFVVIPGASPQIMTGIRVGLQVSLLLMVVSEMLASTDGVGFLILQSQQQFRIPDMWAGIIMLGLLGFALNAILNPIERAVLRWHTATHDSRLS